MLPWYSAPTVMHGIVWMVIGHSGTCYRGTQPPRECTVLFGWKSATLVHATVVLSPHGNARYFLDGNRPLWYMLPWCSATTVMHGIFWMVIGHSGTYATVVFSHHGNVWYILHFIRSIFWGYSRVRVVLRCQYVHRTRKSPDLELEYEIQYSGEHNKRQCPDHRQTFADNSCVCVCVCVYLLNCT